MPIVEDARYKANVAKLAAINKHVTDSEKQIKAAEDAVFAASQALIAVADKQSKDFANLLAEHDALYKKAEEVDAKAKAKASKFTGNKPTV